MSRRNDTLMMMPHSAKSSGLSMPTSPSRLISAGRQRAAWVSRSTVEAAREVAGDAVDQTVDSRLVATLLSAQISRSTHAMLLELLAQLLQRGLLLGEFDVDRLDLAASAGAISTGSPVSAD